MRISTASLRLFVAVCSLLIGDGSAATAPAAPAATAVVEIRDFMFQPQTLAVAVGSIVTWINRDDDAHSVVSKTAGFHSNALDTGEKFEFRFAAAGSYQVTCSLHSRMTSTVVVQ